MKNKENRNHCATKISEHEIKKETDPDAADTVAGSRAFKWWKVRFFLCAVIISAFALCDKLDYPFLTVDTDVVYEKIQENYHYTNLKKYVMMLADSEKATVEKE